MRVELLKYKTGYLGVIMCSYDNPILRNDWFLNDLHKIDKAIKEFKNHKYLNKIIFTTPNLELEGVPLIDLNECVIEADKHNDNFKSFTDKALLINQKQHVIYGYNKAKELYKFTEEDVRKTIELSRKTDIIEPDNDYCPYNEWDYSENEIIEQISQPKESIVVEIETYIKSFSFMGKREDILKINTRTIDDKEYVIIKEIYYE